MVSAFRRLSRRLVCRLFRQPGALGVLLLVLIPAARAEGITVAVASNFASVAEELAAAFEAETGHSVALSSASSGLLYAKIRQGAPYDLLLSADEARPARLEREGLGVSGTRFTYALGRLALWAPGGLPEGDAATVLQGADFRRLALANPELAPYGLAARQSLQALGLWESLRPRLVYGESVAQALALVATGNAPAGLVALAQLHEGGLAGPGEQLVLPASLHAPIRQQAILLEGGAGNAAAPAFLDYLKSEAARSLIRARGYDLEPVDGSRRDWRDDRRDGGDSISVDRP